MLVIFQALSATDLSIVLYVCGAVDPDTVFNESCPLTQPVLLSLIQQLSVHFESDLELKHRYGS
jgi:enhancer of mRNA-decapping protein 4